jgi:hypothetical protein
VTTEDAAERVLIAHQRRDIGSCLCGWGVDTGDLGRSHAAHVWEQLAPVVREIAADELDTAADDADETPRHHVTAGWLRDRAAELRRP